MFCALFGPQRLQIERKNILGFCELMQKCSQHCLPLDDAELCIAPAHIADVHKFRLSMLIGITVRFSEAWTLSTFAVLII